jgi:hypothetical protein
MAVEWGDSKMMLNKENYNWGTVKWVGVALLLFLIYFVTAEFRLNRYREQVAEQNSLIQAVSGKVTYYKNSLNEEVATKVTMQASLKTLQSQNSILSENQRELVERIKNNKKIIAAGLAQINFKIDRIESEASTVTDTTVTFNVSTDSISYDLMVEGVKPIGVNPKHVLTSLRATNKMEVVFDWGDKKDGYPVKFSVANSNPLFKVGNIDSYVIPEIKKEELKPTFGQKIRKGIRDNKTAFILGASVGVASAILVTK